MRNALAAVLLPLAAAAQVPVPAPVDTLAPIEAQAVAEAEAYLKANAAKFGLSSGVLPAVKENRCFPDPQLAGKFVCRLKFERQLHQGVPVEGSEIQVNVFGRPGAFSATGGGRQFALTLSATPTLDAAAAASALKTSSLPCSDFTMPGRPGTGSFCAIRDSEIGTPELIVATIMTGAVMGGKPPALAWSFQVVRKMPSGTDYRFLIYIDAHTGAVVHQRLESPIF